MRVDNLSNHNTYALDDVQVYELPLALVLARQLVLEGKRLVRGDLDVGLEEYASR
jgi:hypothetical protein